MASPSSMAAICYMSSPIYNFLKCRNQTAAHLFISLRALVRLYNFFYWLASENNSRKKKEEINCFLLSLTGATCFAHADDHRINIISAHLINFCYEHLFYSSFECVLTYPLFDIDPIASSSRKQVKHTILYLFNLTCRFLYNVPEIFHPEIPYNTSGI